VQLALAGVCDPRGSRAPTARASDLAEPQQAGGACNNSTTLPTARQRRVGSLARLYAAGAGFQAPTPLARTVRPPVWRCAASALRRNRNGESGERPILEDPVAGNRRKASFCVAKWVSAGGSHCPQPAAPAHFSSPTGWCGAARRTAPALGKTHPGLASARPAQALSFLDRGRTQAGDQEVDHRSIRAGCGEIAEIRAQRDARSTTAEFNAKCGASPYPVYQISPAT